MKSNISPSEVRSDNELIAEFMGAVWNERVQCWEFEKTAHTQHSLPYDTSWDWLMPVVEKIHKVKGSHVIIRQTSCEVYMWGKLISSNGQEAFIQSVYQAVVEFIKWYNSQNK